LLKKVVDVYGRAAILIADVPAVSTYVALGYPQNRAWRDKALPQGNNLRNRVLRAMKDFLLKNRDMNEPVDDSVEVTITLSGYYERLTMGGVVGRTFFFENQEPLREHLLKNHFLRMRICADLLRMSAN
jgi:predicted NAD/FAD-binding protein